MFEPEYGSGKPSLKAILTAGLSLALLIAAGCGSDGASSGATEFQKVTPYGQTLSVDDFLRVGFKKDKQYDVTGLPGGIDARMGYWGMDPYNRNQYELRFYISHEEAIELGTELAEEVVGEAAWEHRRNPTWEDGEKDRWQLAMIGAGPIGDASSSGQSPKYGDYSIFGNVVLLCEGADSGQALERCEALINALSARGTE